MNNNPMSYLAIGNMALRCAKTTAAGRYTVAELGRYRLDQENAEV
jgi:hypothetical protein